MRNRGVTPHEARPTRSVIDGRATRHRGYRMSQKIREQVEKIFGWMKTMEGFRRSRYRGVERTGLARYFVATVHNFVRMANLLAATKIFLKSLPRLLSGISVID